ncbi:MAG TPA: hypothetical protein VF172_03885 [Nitrososphaera sp.]|jgi:hypothetical protein
MAKASRRVKTLTINKSRDIVVDKLLKYCQDGTHQKCTGWAVLKKEISPIDANYFLKCTCACHRKKEAAKAQIKPRKTIVARKVSVPKKKKKKTKREKKKAKGKQKRKQKRANKRSIKKKGMKTTRRR